MPVYEYKCPECNFYDEVLSTKYIMSNWMITMCFCGTKMNRIMPKSQAKPVILEYYSESADAYFTGPAQRARVLKEKNLEPASGNVSGKNHHGGH